MLYPEMLEDILAFQDKLTECVGAGVPVPVSASLMVEVSALLTNESDPLVVPDTKGLNVTLKEALVPAAIVRGNESPLTLNIELLVLAPVIVTFAPLAVSVPEAVPLVPTTTFPKPKVVGDTVNWPSAVAPAPDNGIVNVGLGAFEVMVMLPLTLPDAVGEKLTLNVTPWPAASVTGAEMPLRLNPDPLAASLEIVMLDPPVLFTVPDKFFLVPTCTLPKPRLVGLDATAPAERPVPLRAIVSVGLEASEVMAIAPVALPVDCGAKATVNVVL